VAEHYATIPLIVDTSAWIRQRDPGVRPRWDATLRAGLLAACPVVALEVLAAARDKTEFTTLAAALDALPQAPVTTSACRAGALNHGDTLRRAQTDKEQLRDAIEALSEDEARDALRYLEVRRVDPVLAAFLAAPLDDEPVTEEEERSVADARAEYRRCEAVPLDEIRHEFE
jgi:predicted nucleic acid-binding protein